MNNLTEEQQKDVDERATKFKEKYAALAAEFQMDFICYPQLVPTQEGHFVTIVNMQIVDRKYTPVPSPIIKEK